jgi:uncharacterized protein (TIGR00255 family)
MSQMFSMTGFSRAEHKATDYHLVWELKSVNHRYLETAFRLPESLRSIERSLRDKARGLLARGKLDASLKLDLLPFDWHTEYRYRPPRHAAAKCRANWCKSASGSATNPASTAVLARRTGFVKYSANPP